MYVHLQWLEKDFLGYLDKWEASVRAREGFTRAEKTSMTLSKETLEGLRLTGIHVMYDCKHTYTANINIFYLCSEILCGGYTLLVDFTWCDGTIFVE